MHAWHSDKETSSGGSGFASLWLGIRNTARDSSLKFIPGSHLYGRTVQESRSLRNVARDETDDDVILDLARGEAQDPRVEQPDCSDGEGIVFDGRIWHGSKNASQSGARIALLLQYAQSSRPVRAVDSKGMNWPIRVTDVRVPVLPAFGCMDCTINDIAGPPIEQLGRLGFVARQLNPPLALNTRGSQAYPILKGRTPNVRALSAHASVLAPGKIPHPPHQHIEEEILVVLQGNAELTLPENGKDQQPKRIPMGPGSFAYYPAYRWHTLRNAGADPLSYVMLKWSGPPVSSGAACLSTILHRLQPAPPADQAYSNRRIFEGPTQFLRKFHAHESFLKPGGGYQVHSDDHDVAIVVLEGLIAVNGRQLGPSGVMHCPAGVPHDMRNLGTADARYLVFEFHGPRRLMGRFDAGAAPG